MAKGGELTLVEGVAAEAWAKLHSEAFAAEAPLPWSRAAFAEAAMDLTTDGIAAYDEKDKLLGVTLVRTLFEDAELLTLAVAPKSRKRGIGAALLRAAETAALRRGAERLLLEVDTDAQPALALYSTSGYSQVGQRRAYYIDGFGRPHDAQILAKLLTELD